MFLVLLSFEIVAHGLGILYVVYIASLLNELYDEHISRLVELKNVVTHIKAFRNHYLGITSKDFNILDMEKEMMFKEDLSDLVGVAISKGLKAICPSEDVCLYLDKILMVFDEIILDLENEKEFDLVKFLGIPITKTMFIRTLVGSIGSILALMRMVITSGMDNFGSIGSN